MLLIGLLFAGSHRCSSVEGLLVDGTENEPDMCVMRCLRMRDELPHKQENAVLYAYQHLDIGVFGSAPEKFPAKIAEPTTPFVSRHHLGGSVLRLEWSDSHSYTDPAVAVVAQQIRPTS
jgi:hypothetical protein